MSSSANECCICLESAQSRGGVPLYSPGCCGKWFHQSCIDGLIANGDDKCPACRATFPIRAAAAAPAVVAAAAAPRRSFTNMFGFGGRANSNNLPPPQVQQVQQQQVQQQQFISPNVFNVGNMNNAPVQQMHYGGHRQNSGREHLSASQVPEDLLEAAAEPTNKEKKASGAPSLPTVTASTSPEFPVTSLAATDSFYVRVGLTFEEASAAATSDDKVPLDIVCILDNSGSMSGSKLASLKEAMNFVIGVLGPQDRLSVVYFNSQAGIVHGLLKMTPENKEKSRQLLSALEATGGTDIYDGMRYGWEILQNRRTFNPTSCVFLLTDGQDRGRLPEKLELAKTIKSRGASLFVFGFGGDHDSQHMAAIAEAGECPFTYIESDDMVVDAFGGSIGTQQGASLRNVTLTIAAAAEGIAVAQGITGSYAHAIAPGGRSVAVTFANMYVGESRDVLVRLSLPALPTAVAEYPLVSASAVFSVQVSGSSAVQGTSTTSQCVIRRVPAGEIPATITRDVEVDVQLNRIRSVEAITSALASADNNNFGVASDTLKAALEAVKASVSFRNAHRVALALASDLTDALTRVQSRSAYAAGGRAMLNETSVNNDRQRSCYTKAGRSNAYQSASSESCQQSAFASKSSTHKW